MINFLVPLAVVFGSGASALAVECTPRDFQTILREGYADALLKEVDRLFGPAKDATKLLLQFQIDGTIVSMDGRGAMLVKNMRVAESARGKIQDHSLVITFDTKPGTDYGDRLRTYVVPLNHLWTSRFSVFEEAPPTPK